MSETVMKRVKEVLGGQRISVECTTCQQIFLNMNYMEFVELHSMDPQQPDKWFVRGALHWLLNKEHIIMANIPMLPTNMTELYKDWRNNKANEGKSEENMIAEAQRYLDGCKLPI